LGGKPLHLYPETIDFLRRECASIEPIWQPKTMTDWTIANIPSQAGKLAVVTGATGGLGYQTAMRLAQAGAEVVLTGRNEAKAAKRSRKSATIP
jgi:NADPH:quinone reductase-like Zn-dependent oxidoreductase